MYQVILNDSKLINNTKYTSEVFKIDEKRLIAVIDEFKKTGCIILQSKINGRYKINQRAIPSV